MGKKNWFMATLLSSFTRNSSLQALYPVEILGFFYLEGWRGGVHKLLWFYNLSGAKVLVWLQKYEIKQSSSNILLGDGKRTWQNGLNKSKSLIIDKIKQYLGNTEDHNKWYLNRTEKNVYQKAPILKSCGVCGQTEQTISKAKIHNGGYYEM